MNDNAQTPKNASNTSEWSSIKQKLSALWADKRSFKKRLLLSGSAMLAACFMFIFFGPLELIAFSGDSFIYSYRDVLWVLLCGFLIIWAVGTLLISLLRGKIFNYVVCSVFSFAVCGLLLRHIVLGLVQPAKLYRPFPVCGWPYVRGGTRQGHQLFRLYL